MKTLKKMRDVKNLSKNDQESIIGGVIWYCKGTPCPKGYQCSLGYICVRVMEP